MKKKIFIIEQEIIEFKEKENDHEIFRVNILEKLKSIDVDIINREKEDASREKMLISHCQELENSVFI